MYFWDQNNGHFYTHYDGVNDMVIGKSALKFHNICMPCVQKYTFYQRGFNSIQFVEDGKKKRFCLQIAIFPNKFFLLLFFFVVCFLKKLVPFLDMIVILHELQQLCLKDFWLTFIVPHLEKREMKFEIEHRAHSYTFAELYVYFYCDCVNVTCVCM